MKMESGGKTKSVRVRRTSGRNPREDGDSTKARIIEEAGRLFAERGYADTTCKDICEQAGTNIASVNYHFGSREGLYLAVLEEVHKSIFNLEALTEIADSHENPKVKMATFIDNLVSAVFNAKRWQVRVWGREMTTPSGLDESIRHERGTEKFGKVAKIISEITGLPIEDPRMKLCILNVMSPCLVLLIVPRRLPNPHQQIFESEPVAVATHLKDFIFAGLEAFSVKRSQKEDIMSAFTSTS